MSTIRNPLEWGADLVKDANAHLRSVTQSLRGSDVQSTQYALPVRRIQPSDLREVLTKGVEDFKFYRTDVVFLCIIYPVVGLVLARVAFSQNLLPLLFPLASGFALIGPVAAVGLYEMSRQREMGRKATWADAFSIVSLPSFGAILMLGVVLLAIFLLWLMSAQLIYAFTLGPEPPASVGAFMWSVFTTGSGWAMVILGVGVGFLFALLVLSISVVSFPLLLDQDVGLVAAIATSLRVVSVNPVPMAAWGLIVASGLLIGSLPLLLGLIVVLPVLGHATWHLYRKVVVT